MDSPDGKPRDTPSTKLNSAMPKMSRSSVDAGSVAYTLSGADAAIPHLSRSSSSSCARRYITKVVAGNIMLMKNAVFSSMIPIKMPMTVESASEAKATRSASRRSSRI